jgi:aminopeptidase N
MAHDGDPFARWEAGQQLGVTHIQELVKAHQEGRPLKANASFIAAIGATLHDTRLDKAFIAQMITLPGEAYLGEIAQIADPIAIHEAREFLRGAIATSLRDQLVAHYRASLDQGPYKIDQESMAKRALKNAVLYTLMGQADEEVIGLAVSQYRTASNMTDALGALALLADSDAPERLGALAIFAEKWRGDALVLDKWFGIQAMSSRADTLERVTELLGHPAFDLKNPNKVRALIGSFASGNPYRFHDASGSGYRFLADQVLALDPINGKVAARMISPLIRWRKYDEKRQILMRAELERVVGTEGLSKDVFEIASKGLSSA